MRTRLAIATVSCLTVLLGTTGVAGAGNSNTSGAVFAECNTTTGNFDVTLTNGSYEAKDVNDNDIVLGDLTFNPSSLNNAEQTVVTFTVPGNTFDLYTTWKANGVFGNATEFDLDPCVAVAPTTEPPTTVPGTTTSTEAPVAAAAVASPRFTG